MEIYVTPPIVTYEERILPDTAISPDFLSKDITLQGAKNQIIPATFILKSDENIENVTIEHSSNIDIKIVKCWYQNGHELHGDLDVIELLPELLLNDEKVIEVDHENKDNYAKINGEYMMISERTYEYHPLSPTIEEFPIVDAETLQPFILNADENKQIWITINTKDYSVGTYNEQLLIKIDEEIADIVNIHLTVLPINLKNSPKEGCLYYTARLDNNYPEGKIGNSPRSEQQILKELQNLKEHGVTNPTCYQGRGNFTLLGRYMELRQQAGIENTNLYWLGMAFHSCGDDLELLQQRYIEAKDFLSTYGVENLYIYGPDEKDMNNPENRAQIQAIHDVGGFVFNAQGKALSEGIADVLDLANIPGMVDDTYYADLYHSYGHKLFSYANPQAGVEQPLNYRKNYGLYLWQRDFDGGMTFAYHYGPGNLYNDWDWVYDCYPPQCDPERHRRYKQHVFAYPTVNGVIDTIEWEGFREGSIDLQYLQTLLDTIDEAKTRGIDTIEAEEYVNWLRTINLAEYNLEDIRNDLSSYILSLQQPNIIVPLASGIVIVITIAAIYGFSKR